MYMYARHVVTWRKPIAACAEIAIFLAICEEIAFFFCPNTAEIRHAQGPLEHIASWTSYSERCQEGPSWTVLPRAVSGRPRVQSRWSVPIYLVGLELALHKSSTPKGGTRMHVHVQVEY